jgi:hypothetical protein
VTAPSTAGCRAKVRRAEYHLEVLEGEIGSFRDLHPVRFTVDRDLEKSSYVFRVWDIAEPDAAWGLLVGDCFHNARSALDHLAYQLVILNLGRDLTDDEARRVMFPIYETPKLYTAYGAGRVADLRIVDRARIEILQSYHAWDEGIWGPDQMPGPPAPVPSYLSLLSRLDNSDKHRTIQPVWLAAGLGGLPKDWAEVRITGGGTTDSPLNDGAEIGRWFFDGTPPEPPAEMDVERYFAIQVSLWQPFFATRVQRILGNCITAVTMVLDMFEPCLVHGSAPAPLRYWDGGPPWL